MFNENTTALTDATLGDDAEFLAPLLGMKRARAALRLAGGLGRLVSAPEEKRRDAFGLSESESAACEYIASAARRMARESIVGDALVLGSWDKIIAYARTEFGHQATESFFVLFLDRKNKLISAEELGRGTVDHAPVYPREVCKRALALDASSVVLLHNHPSGETTPSRADIDMTRELMAALKTLGIAVHDHLVVSSTGHSSLRALGLM